jgi:hypothetical protein
MSDSLLVGEVEAAEKYNDLLFKKGVSDRRFSSTTVYKYYPNNSIEAARNIGFILT